MILEVGCAGSLLKFIMKDFLNLCFWISILIQTMEPMSFVFAKNVELVIC